MAKKEKKSTPKKMSNLIREEYLETIAKEPRKPKETFAEVAKRVGIPKNKIKEIRYGSKK
jgi:hypothetical protein